MLMEYAARPASEEPAVAAEEYTTIQEARAILDATPIDTIGMLRGLADVMEQKMVAHPDEPTVILRTVIVSMRETADLLGAARP